MFLITEFELEKKKKYFINPLEKQFFGNKYGQISVNEIQKLWYGHTFTLWKKKYLICKPTIFDYILYWLKRKTQIIYPTEAWFISNLINPTKNDKIFESWVGSGALSLILLNQGANLYSFEKRKEFIDLVTENIKIRFNFVNQNYSHKIFEKDILNDDLTEFNDFFDKAILDIKDLPNGIIKVYPLIKNWWILILWAPTANQVIETLQTAQWLYFPDEIYTLNQTQWIPISQRFRIEDWQTWSRWFVIKLVKIKK